MRIVDSDAVCVAVYRYDPYGNLVSSSGDMVSVNPLRYRGYYYDTETGFYYLQSRYYDPELGRFINADSLVSTGQGILGNNMFAYCLNNPVNFSDNAGSWARVANPDASCFDAHSAGGGGIVPIYLFTGLIDWFMDVVDGFGSWRYLSSQKQAVSRASQILDFASTTAPPPPPNKGGKGTQVTTETLYTKRGKNGFRIDVENPGNRLGQIHLQKGTSKYIYNNADQTFRVGSTAGPLAPNSIQQLLELPEVIIAISKGLIILGY